ncbi:hypothetical protein KPL70_008304 [Citrus sinensis]|nr:hypothetical protein KPL70_008304 [Citrus sinensis]
MVLWRGKNWTIMEMARCLFHDKGLPKKFWAEVVKIAIFLLNRLPTKALQKKTPFEAWYGYKPKLLNLKIFGCLCFSYIPQVKRDKLDKKAELGIFVGYSSTSKAYRIYLSQNNKVIVSMDVQFFELDNWDELKMIEKNQTWELADRREHKKAMGVKWVYRTKLNLNDYVNKYKARLVIKGYAQVFGVDFFETFAHVARLDTIRILLALAAQHGWVMHQMDVKSVFF